MMYHQSSTRNQRSKVSNAKKALQAAVLLAVACWLIYQAKKSREKGTENVVKAAENKLGKAAEEISLGRKGDAGSENVVIIDSSSQESDDKVDDVTSLPDDNVEATKKNDKKLEDGSSDHVSSLPDDAASTNSDVDDVAHEVESSELQNAKSNKEESQEEEDAEKSSNVSVESGADKSSKIESSNNNEVDELPGSSEANADARVDDAKSEPESNGAEDDVAASTTVETRETDFGTSSGSGDRVREETPEKQDTSL